MRNTAGAQAQMPQGELRLMHDPGDSDFHREHEKLTPMVRHMREERERMHDPAYAAERDAFWRAQQISWAMRQGGPIWVDALRSVGIGPGPAGSITFAIADRKATAFVTPYAGWHAFRDFAEGFGANPIIAHDKERVPLVSLAWIRGAERRLVWPNGKTWDTGGAQRMVFNCAGVTCIGLDFDDGDTTLEGIVAALRKHGLEGFVHSTRSHTVEKPRHRCIIPLTQPYYVQHDDRDERSLYKARYHGLARMLGAGTADRACSDPLRLFRLPSHKPDEAGSYEHAYVAGDALDFDRVEPFWGAGGKRRTFREDGDAQPRASIKRIEEALTCIPACVEYPTWRDAVWAVHSAVHGTTDETAGRKCVEAWSKTCPAKFDQRAFDELWASADADGGITILSLWHIARDYGFDINAIEEQAADEMRHSLLGDLS